MQTTEPPRNKPRLEKVGECLYRYSSNGVYYALVKIHGKQKKCSLENTDKALAKRKLADLKRQLGVVDFTAGKATLRELCQKYLATIQNQKPATVYRKTYIAERCNMKSNYNECLAKALLPETTSSLWLYLKGCYRVSFHDIWRDVHVQIEERPGKFGPEYIVTDGDRLFVHCGVGPSAAESPEFLRFEMPAL